MTKQEIIDQAVWAARNGYASICLQAGERRDEKFISFIEECLREIHKQTVSDVLLDGVGVTLSLGEQTKEVYERWAVASGNRSNLRYLARFETSNADLFCMLHSAKSFRVSEAFKRMRLPGRNGSNDWHSRSDIKGSLYGYPHVPAGRCRHDWHGTVFNV